MKMLRKIDQPIENCRECPNLRYNVYVRQHHCDGDIENDTISDIDGILDNCPLPDAGVKTSCVVMLIRDGKVLLGERGEDCQTSKGEFAFPGGRMDYGNTPKQSAVREVFEETGLVIEEKDLKFFRYVDEYFPNEKRHYVSLVFVVVCPKGEPINKEPDKCKGWEWIDPDNLPNNTFWAVRESIELFK